MNTVCLTGRLGANPEVRYSTGENATAFANFSLGVKRRYKNKETGEYDTDWIRCKASGHNAEFIEKYFTKGMKADVTGHIQTGSYTNKEGNKVYTTDIIVDSIEFGESKNSTNTEVASKDEEFMTIPDGAEDEMPF